MWPPENAADSHLWFTQVWGQDLRITQLSLHRLLKHRDAKLQCDTHTHQKMHLFRNAVTVCLFKLNISD